MATVVLVHGLWLTPRCWEHWIARYERAGHRVLAPAYPGLDAPVEALRADPAPVAALTPEAVLAHLEAVIPDDAIVIGHSFGGVLARRLCASRRAGVALHALPGTGGSAGASMLTPDQFRYALANAMDDAQAARLYDRYAIPAPGAWAFDAPPGAALEIGGDEDNLGTARGARLLPGRCHLTLLQDGWEAVADYVLDAALRLRS